MKRKKFIKTLGVGVFALYASGLSACRKTNVEPDPIVNNPGEQGTAGGGRTLGDDKIVDGYTNKLSYSAGETMNIYLNSNSSSQERIGLYTPNGILKNSVTCDLIPQTHGPEPYKNGYQYTPSFSFTIPDNLPSGLYYWAKKVPFVVKNKNRSASIVVVLPSNTDNAYNKKGGLSSYTSPMSPVLSFQRPYDLARWHEAFWPWLETLNYIVDYIIDQDLDDEMNFSYSKLLVLPGHNEYWTRKARMNFDRFVDSGKNALILSGNTMWWQIRYSNDNNQMICYKILNNDPITDQSLKTTLWTTPSLKYTPESSIAMNFDLGGYGDEKNDGWKGYKILKDKSPLLNGTGLKNGDVIKCLSQEYDGTFVKYEPGNPHPVVDNKLNFHKIELVGYDYGFRGVKTVGTFLVLKKTINSGVIVNTASVDWCSKRGMGGKDGDKIKKITINAIELLLTDGNVFSS
jgi:hypothetical protein